MLLSLVFLVLTCKKRSSEIKSVNGYSQSFISLSAQLKNIMGTLDDNRKRKLGEELQSSDLSLKERNRLFYRATKNNGIKITDLKYILTTLMNSGADTSEAMYDRGDNSVACETVSKTLSNVISEKHHMDRFLQKKATQRSNYLTDEQKLAIFSNCQGLVIKRESFFCPTEAVYEDVIICPEGWQVFYNEMVTYTSSYLSGCRYDNQKSKTWAIEPAKWVQYFPKCRSSHHEHKGVKETHACILPKNASISDYQCPDEWKEEKNMNFPIAAECADNLGKCEPSYDDADGKLLSKIEEVSLIECKFERKEMKQKILKDPETNRLYREYESNYSWTRDRAIEVIGILDRVGLDFDLPCFTAPTIKDYLNMNSDAFGERAEDLKNLIFAGSDQGIPIADYLNKHPKPRKSDMKMISVDDIANGKEAGFLVKGLELFFLSHTALSGKKKSWLGGIFIEKQCQLPSSYEPFIPEAYDTIAKEGQLDHSLYFSGLKSMIWDVTWQEFQSEITPNESLECKESNCFFRYLLSNWHDSNCPIYLLMMKIPNNLAQNHQNRLPTHAYTRQEYWDTLTSHQKFYFPFIRTSNQLRGSSLQCSGQQDRLINIACIPEINLDELFKYR